ncbi:MAG: GIY-YIG nuclease family protein, partial [Patescibacteria group bacterium]
VYIRRVVGSSPTGSTAIINILCQDRRFGGQDGQNVHYNIHVYYTYILRSIKFGRFYVGSTDDLKRRFHEHNSGKNFSTKPYIPYELLFYEAVPTHEEALAREKFYKSGRGREFLKKILFKTLEQYICNLPS